MTSKRNVPYGGQIKKPASLNPLDDIYGTLNDSRDRRTIPIDQIQLPPKQPRRYFNPETQQQLVASIRQHGILQPLVVRPLPSKGFELVAGERRYRAAKEIGLIEVPTVERELDETQAFEIALIENLLREDLNPVDETEGILQLLASKLNLDVSKIPPLLYRLNNEANSQEAEVSHNVMTNSEEPDSNHNVMVESEDAGVNHNVMASSELQTVQTVFKSIGTMTWRSFVKNRLPLLKLPEDVLAAVRSGRLEYTKAKAIAQVKEDKSRVVLLEKVISEKWSLQEIKEHLKQVKPEPKQIPLKNRLESTYKKAKKLKIWDVPDKQKRLEKLIAELDELLSEVGSTD